MPVKGHNKLFFRIFALFCVFVLLIVLLIGFMVIPLHKKFLQEIMYTQAISVSRSIIQVCSEAMINTDINFIGEHNLEVLKNNPRIQYILISPQHGENIFIFPSGWKVNAHLDPVLAKLETGQGNHLFLENKLVPSRVYHFTYAINFSDIKWGWIHIGFSTQNYEQHIKEINVQIAYAIGISLLLIIVLGFFFARWITSPVLALSALATQVASGNLNVAAEVQRNDEIGNLFKSFNQMVSVLKLSSQNLENYKQQLEVEVQKRTRQLDDLNKNLDYRVKSEISRRREQEQLLIYQSRLAAIGEMVGAIAHQWRQPLNALGLVLQNLHLSYRQGKLDDAGVKRSIEKSERLINKMSSTIDDFRGFFKPDKQAEYFNLRQAIQSVIELLEASLKNDAIKTTMDCDSKLEILGSLGEFSQVILNLVTNAKDALLEQKPENPQISVQVAKKMDKIIIHIMDNAGGIEQQNLYKIFDPYFSTKPEGQGTGIGLYMSKMIVEKNMGGKLLAENNPQGATFTIELKAT